MQNHFGNQRFLMITKQKYIFVYLVEDVNPVLQRYMYLMVEEFFDMFKESLLSFSGDVTPYKGFDVIFDQYFSV